MWLDRERLLPGVRWRQEITEAIRTGDFFLACFSTRSEIKERSFMREEIAIAIEELRLRPSDKAWFIPVLLSPCSVPDHAIGGSERLSDLQYVDLSNDWNGGVDRLATSLGGAEPRG